MAPGLDHLTKGNSGFDYWNVLPGQGRYIDPILITKDGKMNFKGKYSEDVITDLSLDWIKKRDKEKPFVLLLSLQGAASAVDPAPRFANICAARRPRDWAFSMPPLIDRGSCARRSPAVVWRPNFERFL